MIANSSLFIGLCISKCTCYVMWTLSLQFSISSGINLQWILWWGNHQAFGNYFNVATDILFYRNTNLWFFQLLFLLSLIVLVDFPWNLEVKTVPKNIFQFIPISKGSLESIPLLEFYLELSEMWAKILFKVSNFCTHNFKIGHMLVRVCTSFT